MPLLQTWGIARFFAPDRALHLLPQTTGPSRHHVTHDGVSIHVFALRKAGAARWTSIPVGTHADIEVLIHHDCVSVPSLEAGWRIHESPAAPLGHAVLLQAFKTWEHAADTPTDIERVEGAFMRI